MLCGNEGKGRREEGQERKKGGSKRKGEKEGRKVSECVKRGGRERGREGSITY